MKRQILAVSILLVATQLFGQESRFWVGGSGKWADNSHWATVSGGEPGATVPESGTSVVFDANSFSGAKNTVTLSDEVVIGSLTASDAEFVFSGKKDLTVGGSVNVDSNVDFGKLRGALVLSAEGNQTLNLPATLEGDIVINGGNWTLASDLATEGNITLNAGSLNTAGHSVTCSVFTATENAEALNIENSSMITDKWFTNAAENMTVKAAGSTVFVYKHASKNFVKADGQLYSRVSIKSAEKDGPTLVIDTVREITCPVNAIDLGDPDIYVATYHVKVEGISTYCIGVLDGSNQPDIFNKEGEQTVQLGEGTYRIGFYSGHLKSKYNLDEGYLEVKVVGKPKFEGGIAVKTDANCFGGDVVLQNGIVGGTGNFECLWNEGDPNEKVCDTIIAEDGNNIYLKVTDELGCQYSPNTPFRYFSDKSYNSYKTGPQKIDTVGIERVSACEDENTGSIKVKAKEGYKSHTFYQYTLSGPVNDVKKGAIGAEVEFGELKKGDYTIKITDDKCESDVLSFSLGEVTKPTVNLGADEYVCEGEETYTIKNVEVTGTYTSLEWTSDEASVAFADDDQKTVKKPKLILVGTDTTHMTLVAINGSCKTVPAKKKVTVIPAPAPEIKTANDSAICGLEVEIKAIAGVVGNDKNLTADVKPLDGGAKASGSKGLNLKVTKAGRYKVFVKELKKENGCNCYGVSDTITLTFYDKPVFKETKFDAPSSVCGEGVLSSITVNTKNATTFKWTLEKGADSSFGPDDEATTEYTTQEDDIITHKSVRLKVVASNDGCTDKNAISDTISFVVYAKPDPKIKETKYTTCNDTIELEGTITAGNTATWTPSDKKKVKIISSKIDKTDKTKITAKAVLIAGADHKTYTVTLDEKGKGDCGTIKSKASDLEFKGRPSITMVEHDYKFCDGPMTYTAKFTNLQSATYIHWGESSEFAIDPPVFDDDTSATYTFKKQNLTELKKVTIYVYAEDPGCPSTSAVDSVVVKVLPIPNITINKDTAVCGTTYKVPTYVPSVKGDDKIIPTYSWGKAEGENNADFDIKTGIFKPKNMGDKDSVICRLNLTEKIDACSGSKDANVLAIRISSNLKPVAILADTLAIGYPDAFDANALDLETLGLTSIT